MDSTKPEPPTRTTTVPDAAANAADRLQALAQHCYPQHTLSALMLRATRIRCRSIRRRMIGWFIRRYGVHMEEAADPDPESYPDFNTFFTRALRAGARPLSPDPRAVACPADGEVSQIGDITGERLLQAKGRSYTLQRLLGGDETRCAPFRSGRFATVYLSPKDYHRVHMPVGGRLREMVHIPGRLFSVNQSTTRVIPDLFARNERVISLFETGVGPMAVILVGAIFVGSIETVWAGAVTPARERRVRTWRYGEGAQRVDLQRGAEMGRFNMGSTVIVLFAGGAVRWSQEIRAGTPVRMGQAIGVCAESARAVPDAHG